MFKANPLLTTPDDDFVIRRYMDWPKFINLLTSETLYFARADTMEDQWEGFYVPLSKPALAEATKNDDHLDALEGPEAKAHAEKMMAELSSVTLPKFPNGECSEVTDAYEKVLASAKSMCQAVIGDDGHLSEENKALFGGQMQGIIENLLHGTVHLFRLTCYLNCWHGDSAESVAMWKLYALQGQGIAVETDIGHLKRALRRSLDDVFIGKVEYRDFDNPPLEERYDPLIAFFRKKQCFSYESEVRALVNTKPKRELPGVPIDVKALIKSVIIAPHSPKWYAKEIAWLLKKAGHKNIPVIESTIGKRPFISLARLATEEQK